MQYIHTEQAPAAIGPYSQAVRVDRWVFCSGQIPINPATNAVEHFDGNAAKQAVQVLANLEAVLRAAGATPSSVVKTTIYLVDMQDFTAVNDAYAQFFGAHKPARATVAVARLPKDVRVEIDAIAYV